MLKFQCWVKLSWIHAVVFNSICIFNNFAVFKSRNSSVHRKLYIFWQRRAHSPNIHFIGVKTFWFDKNLVPLFIRKFNHFVFDRRTVTRTSSFDNTGINWGTVKICTNNFMCFFICVGEPTGYLINLNFIRVCRKRKRHNPLVAKLLFHLGKINRAFVHSSGSTCLKSTHFHTKRF